MTISGGNLDTEDKRIIKKVSYNPTQKRTGSFGYVSSLQEQISTCES
jgi:hypothetical protein